jgi:hypothetical protein
MRTRPGRSTAPKVPSRTVAAKRLRQLARVGTVLYTELEAPLRRAVLLYWGDMDGARQALNLRRPQPARQQWSRERVIDEIRRLHRSGQHMSVTAVASVGRNDLVMAATQYVGSWVLARELAGVAFERNRVFAMPVWDAATVVAEIQQRHLNGQPLASSKCPRSLTCAAGRIFGAWRNAIAAAGIDYNTILLLRRYSDSELLAWLRELAETRPAMTLFDLDKLGEHTVACRRRWGSLEVAAKAAGLSGWPARIRSPAMSRTAVVRLLRRWHKEGVPLRSAAVRRIEGGHHVITSAAHHFKTWNAAVDAALRH